MKKLWGEIMKKAKIKTLNLKVLYLDYLLIQIFFNKNNYKKKKKREIN